MPPPDLPSPASRLHPGMVIGAFEVVDLLGSGAFSEVYRVRMVATGQLLALKLLTSMRPSAKKRFRRELGALVALRHPNVVRCRGSLEVVGCPSILMDCVEGPNLRQWMHQPKGFTAGLAERLQLVRDATAGVMHLHAKGLVHRDLKPENILLAPRGRGFTAQVTDLGLVRDASLPEQDGLTRTGAMMGTVGYMAPEQAIDAKRVGPAADLFAIGCILYELMTGCRAFPGANHFSVVQRMLDCDFVEVPRVVAGLPTALTDTIHACLHPTPSQRPDSAVTLLARLSRVDLTGIPLPPEMANPTGTTLGPAPTGVPESESMSTWSTGDWGDT